MNGQQFPASPKNLCFSQCAIASVSRGPGDGWAFALRVALMDRESSSDPLATRFDPVTVAVDPSSGLNAPSASRMRSLAADGQRSLERLTARERATSPQRRPVNGFGACEPCPCISLLFLLFLSGDCTRSGLKTPPPATGWPHRDLLNEWERRLGERPTEQRHDARSAIHRAATGRACLRRALSRSQLRQAIASVPSKPRR